MSGIDIDITSRNPVDAQSMLLLQSITDHAIYMLDVDGKVLSWNPGAERIKGYKAEEIIGRNYSTFYTEEDRAAGLPDRHLEISRLEGRCERQGWRARRDGSLLWASVVIHAVHEKGALVGYAKITRDCTEQQRQAELQDNALKDMALVLSALPSGACLLDSQGCIVLFNPAFLNLFPGASKGADLVGLIGSLCPEGHGQSTKIEQLPWTTAESETGACEIIAGNLIFSTRARAAQGQGWVVTFEDVTAERLAEREMLYRAQHDVLTGLATRDGFSEHLDLGLAECAATGGCGVIYLDLDNFKVVNDTCGHHAGDEVLKEAASRIVNALRPDDFKCRLGGDEFVVVPAWPISEEGSMLVAERLMDLLKQPYLVEERVIEVGVSIGVAVSLPGKMDHTDLTGNADLALYQAKRDGRGCIRLFNEELGVAMLKRRSMELQLSRALMANEFSLAYQPICSAGDQSVQGFEALLRWTQADGTVVSPAVFVPLAEEIGMMAEIGGWVLETACREAAAWPSHLTIAVNVSATQMNDPKLLDRIRSAVEKANLDPRRLEVEITETAMIRDQALTLRVLNELRAFGVNIAIDDFGTGYSSLSFLRTLPFTRVKIDRSFVSDIADNSHSMAIVRGLMRMSRDLGLAVTAEGVETEAQRKILMDESCQELQGFLFAKPMAGQQIPNFLGSSGLAHAS